jgi:hypothetical protein
VTEPSVQPRDETHEIVYIEMALAATMASRQKLKRRKKITTMSSMPNRNTALGITVVWGVMALGGCGSSRETIEQMRTQQVEAEREHAEWRSKIAEWKVLHVASKKPAFTARHATAEDSAKLHDHGEKLAKLEGEIAGFERELDAYDQRFTGSGRSGRPQLAQQGALWADHLKLKLAFAGLEGAQNELTREYAELVAADTSFHTKSH